MAAERTGGAVTDLTGRWYSGTVRVRVRDRYVSGAAGTMSQVAAELVDMATAAGTAVNATPTGPVLLVRPGDPLAVARYLAGRGVVWDDATNELLGADPRLVVPDGAVA